MVRRTRPPRCDRRGRASRAQLLDTRRLQCLRWIRASWRSAKHGRIRSLADLRCITFRDFRTAMIDTSDNQSRYRNMSNALPGGANPSTATDATMMRRRSTDKDPSGTVRVLRWVAVFGLLLPVFLLAVVAWIEHSNILTSAERDGTKIVALFREQAGNLFTGHEIILDMVVNRMRDRNRDKTQFADLLRELEVMDKRLDDASEILLVDAGGAVLASTARCAARSATVCSGPEVLSGVKQERGRKLHQPTTYRSPDRGANYSR